MAGDEKNEKEERRERAMEDGIVLRVKWRGKASGVIGDDGGRDWEKMEFEETKGNREKKKEDDGAK